MTIAPLRAKLMGVPHRSTASRATIDGRSLVGNQFTSVVKSAGNTPL